MITATLIHGTLPLILEGPNKKFGRKGELDTMAWKILVDAATVEASAAALGFVRDSIVASAGHSIWVDAIDQTSESDLLTELSISASGLIDSGDRRRRTLSAGQREISVGPTEKIVLAWGSEQGEDPETSTPLDKVKRRVPKVDGDGEIIYQTITTPSGTQERWNIKDAVLSVRDTYFATTRPSTEVIGTADTPPNAPTPPPYIWASFTDPKRGNHPNGWVLEDRSIDVLHLATGSQTSGLFATTDTWSYYYTELPD